MLKRRIFYSDRFEKVERVLNQLELLPRDNLLYCPDEQLSAFEQALLAEDERPLKTVYEAVSRACLGLTHQHSHEEGTHKTVDEGNLWFEVYRSVSGGGAQGGGDTEEDRVR